MLADVLDEYTYDDKQLDKIPLLRSEKGWWSLVEEESRGIGPDAIYSWCLDWYTRLVSNEEWGRGHRVHVARFSPRVQQVPVCASDKCQSYHTVGEAPAYLVCAVETGWQWWCGTCLLNTAADISDFPQDAPPRLFVPSGTQLVRGIPVQLPMHGSSVYHDDEYE